MIELRDIKKSYGDQQVLKGFDLTIEKGQLCMLLGPSGCGKSTLLKLMNRLLIPDSGTILINGVSINDLPLEPMRRNMGYAIQGAALFPHMRVDENIAIVPKLMKWSQQKISDRIHELLNMVGLPDPFAKKYPYQLSGGEAQRVGVARALAADPEILLLDEPFGALDPVNRLQLQKSFLEIQRTLKKTVVFVTHDVSEAVRMADFLVFMNDGKPVAQGRPFEMSRQVEETVRDFLGNDYTIELLDRITVGDLISWSGRSHTVGNFPEAIPMKPDSTCKELLSFMLMNERNDLVVAMNELFYHVGFEDLFLSLRGGISE